MSSRVYVTLPKPDFEGRSVMLIRPGTCDPSTITIESQFKVSFMHADVVLQEDDRPIVCGEVTIIDLKDVTLSHAVQMTPSVVKKLMVTFQVPHAYHSRLFYTNENCACSISALQYKLNWRICVLSYGVS